MTFKSSHKLLEYLNDTYRKLHADYENLFWIVQMGIADKRDAMNKAEARRDAFRSDTSLKAEVDAHILKAKGALKKRLVIWSKFFGLFQIPAHAVALRKKAADLETAVLRKRATRTEGYIDPYTSAFVEASENSMRMIMRTNPDEAIRKACFEAMEKLPYDTLDEFVQIIQARNAFAKALGYEDFYDYKIHLDEGMTKDELFAIFDKIYEKTKYGFENIRALEKEKPGLRKPWNFAYMLMGNFTKEEDQYFQFSDVLSYWGRSFHALGIDFRGGKLQLDLLDRKGKSNNGFCHYPDLVYFKKGKFMPGSSNFTSTAIPNQVGSGANGIHTVFHEGGHAADRLNSMQEETCLNTEYPPSTISWAETQSMFMDTISSSIVWRLRYAKNAKGEAYPFELFERKAKAMNPLKPLAMMGIHFVMEFERNVYEHKNLTKEAILDIARAANKKFFDRSEDSLSVLNVPHIYSWESSAYYHGYGLADLGVAQWREYFHKKYGYIVDNPKVGKEMAKAWSYGSLYTARELMQKATGKKLGADAYIQEITQPLEKIIETAKKRIARMKKVPLQKGPVKLNAHISLVHGKKKIADNRKSFEDMDAKWRKWLAGYKG